MSAFILKLTALITMFIDHGSILIYRFGYIGPEGYYLLRSIGRIAFPIYAFLLINGFSHSSDRCKYLFRLMLFAVISQLPFSVYFSYPDKIFSLLPVQLSLISLPVLLTGLLWLILYIIISPRRCFRNGLIIFLFMLLPAFRLNLGELSLLSGDMSIFYSLSFGLAIIMLLSAIKEKGIKSPALTVSALALALGLIFVQPRADYGIFGVLLILGLYLFRSSRLLQSLFIALWAFLQYGFSGVSLVYSIFTCLSAVLVFFYNGRKGPGLKYFFYVFYPLHLLILSLLSIL